MPDTDNKRKLEMAAKAAGRPEHSAWLLYPEGSAPAGRRWNPLTDDGDALRLAVKLRLEFEWWKNGVSINSDDLPPMPIEYIGSDPTAATRTAIVRAAAAIGEQMP